MSESRKKLDVDGVAATEEFSTSISSIITNITEEVEPLNQAFATVSDGLGVHKEDFNNICTIIKKGLTDATESLSALPDELKNTIDEINEYIRLHPNVDSGN